jgi:hypothetical protein
VISCGDTGNTVSTSQSVRVCSVCDHCKDTTFKRELPVAYHNTHAPQNCKLCMPRHIHTSR